MNTEMHGKFIAYIDFSDGPSGNPCTVISGHPSTDNGQLSLSATHHGDHDEFWVVTRNAAGVETGRRRAGSVDFIAWEPPK